MKRSKEEYTLLALCAAGIVGITPFAILRLIQQQWLLALIDVVLVAGVIMLGLHVWHSRKVRIPSIILTLFYMSGTILAIYVSGTALIYWAFPATIAAYFLLRPKEAALVNGLAILSLVPAMLIHMEYLEIASLLVTLVLNNIFSFIFARNMYLHHQELELQATRDSLTGAGNRRLFDEKIRECLALYKRHQESTVLVMLDIDHFKKINDDFGHVQGDEVLVNLVDLLRSRLRESDGLFRIGGEEFAILLNRVKPRVAVNVAEDIRSLVENTELLPSMTVTISLGLAACRDNDSSKSWVERSDNALYQAKSEGRNRSCLEN